jgi:AcrR family transcriptional regulator
MATRTKRKSGRQAGTASGRTSRTDWIERGLSVLARHGIDAVRVEPLAASLGVTKGSFYWHFKDRPALHDAMLVHWRGIATDDIVTRTEAAGGSARDKLHRLVALTTDNIQGASLDIAMRSWASHDDEVARAVAAVDAARIGYVRDLLIACGVARPAARTRAEVIYLTLIGSFFTAGHRKRLPGRALWSEVERLAVQPAPR